MKRDWLNLLKVRASYGISGRADYGVNLFQNIYGSGNSYYFQNATNVPSSSSGMKFTQLGIDGLTYEKSHKLNVGIDFTTLNQRLALTIDAFYEYRFDIITDMNSDGIMGYPDIVGKDAALQNLGEVTAVWISN